MIFRNKIITVVSIFAIAFISIVPAYASIGGGRYSAVVDFYTFVADRDVAGGGRFSSREAYDAYVSTLDDPIVAHTDITFYPVFNADSFSSNWDTSSATDEKFTILSTSYFPLSVHFLSTNPYYHMASAYNSTYAVLNSTRYIISVPFSVAESSNYIVDFGSYVITSYSNSAVGSWLLQSSVDGGSSWSTVTSSGEKVTSYSAYGSGSYVCDVSTTLRNVALSNAALYRFRFSWSKAYSQSSASSSLVSPVGAEFYFDVSVMPSISRPGVTVAPASTRSAPIFQTVNNYNSTDNSTNYYIGTIDAGGNVINTYNVDLFDEQTMLIKNPATGETWTATSWEYDYTTRSYDCILDDGNVVSITYGDDYITFMYPDSDGLFHKDYYYYVVTTYNAPSGDTCDHVFTSETTIAPGCITPGERTYTCELCGYTFVESIPAVGHAWYVLESVETELDEDGDVTKVGYTLYGCENCDVTYKQYDGTGQPGPPEGAGSSGTSEETLSWLDKLYSKLCEILAAVTGLDLSPEINVDVDVSTGDGEQTQESWFTTFASKFTWLSSVGSIYEQLVADVTSDADTAAAVAEGSVSVDDLTSNHAAVLADTDTVTYTAPELAISFGSSDKYGVDWENLKVIDLSWYAPYKHTVDSIVSGILWLTYIFLLIKRAPGIIRGAAMVTEDSIKLDTWRWYNGL